MSFGEDDDDVRFLIISDLGGQHIIALPTNNARADDQYAVRGELKSNHGTPQARAFASAADPSFQYIDLFERRQIKRWINAGQQPNYKSRCKENRKQPPRGPWYGQCFASKLIKIRKRNPHDQNTKE